MDRIVKAAQLMNAHQRSRMDAQKTAMARKFNPHLINPIQVYGNDTSP